MSDDYRPKKTLYRREVHVTVLSARSPRSALAPVKRQQELEKNLQERSKTKTDGREKVNVGVTGPNAGQLEL